MSGAELWDYSEGAPRLTCRAPFSRYYPAGFTRRNQQIVDAYLSGASVKVLAERFDVTRSAILRVLHSWHSHSCMRALVTWRRSVRFWEQKGAHGRQALVPGV